MIKPSFVRDFEEFAVRVPYQDNSGQYGPENIVADLRKLETLDPLTPPYWVVRTEIIQRVARNGLEEQFARAKYNAGMLTQQHFRNLIDILENLKILFLLLII